MLDLNNSYYLIRIKEGNKWNIAFETKYNLYEYSIMHFWLIDVPSLFQEMMDKVLQEIKEEVHYLDDILIHTSATEEEDEVSVEQVLERLIDHDLAVKLSKLEFYIKRIVFLEYVINASKVKMD